MSHPPPPLRPRRPEPSGGLLGTLAAAGQPRRRIESRRECSGFVGSCALSTIQNRLMCTLGYRRRSEKTHWQRAQARVGVACVIHLIRRYRDTMFLERLCGYRPQPEEPLQICCRAESME